MKKISILLQALSVIGLLGAVSLSLSAKETIEINTSGTQMVFLAEKGAPVYFYHYGEKVSDASFAARWYRNKPDTGEPRSCEVFPSYGGSNYLTPAVRLTYADGSLLSEFVYESCSKTKPAPGIEQTVITLKERLQDVRLELIFSAYMDEDIIAQSTRIVNNGKKTVTVNEIASSYLPLHSGSYYLSHFDGTWANERMWEEERLTRGSKILESKKGVRTAQADTPSFILSIDSPMQEYSGEVYAGTLAWSGNFRISCQVDEYGILGIVSGINPFASEIKLDAGKSFSTPQMLLAYSPDGVNRISRHFHDWGRRYGLAHGDQLRPVLLNSWEGAYFSFNEKTITDMMDQAADFGIEMFVLDDGWFGNEFPRNSDNAGLGDWQVNIQKLPRGISYLADYAVSKGLRFGIWIEPEMVNPDSNLAHKHPDWIVGEGNGRDNLTMRNQWLLDLTNPKVRDFVVKTFDDVLAMSANITYVKWDANRHVANLHSSYLPKDRQQHFWYEYTAGLYEVYQRVREAHPDVDIQLCSSGGGRTDYGAMRFHDEYWVSDNTNPFNRLFIQWGDSYFFPVKAAAAHVSTSPNHQTGQMLPLKFRFDVAMTGRLGMELQPSSMSGEDADFTIKAIATYKDIRPVIQLGDQYRIVSPYDRSGYCSECFVSKDKTEAVFFAFSTRFHGRTEFFTARMKGLDPSKKYLVQELNIWRWPAVRERDSVMSGDYLMKAGLNLFVTNPFESVVLKLTEVK